SSVVAILTFACGERVAHEHAACSSTGRGGGKRRVSRAPDQWNMLTKQTALTEKGAVVNGRGDTPNMHDILTGSQPDGKAFPPDKDMTCKNWTSSTGGAAMLGHSDRTGLTDDPPGRSWNSSHPSRDCSQDGLKSTGGAGLFYCFATN
ncbi:MAG: hypothetical protein WBO12_18665, partial [Xanthobacteraceae bacterium]